MPVSKGIHNIALYVAGIAVVLFCFINGVSVISAYQEGQYQHIVEKYKKNLVIVEGYKTFRNQNLKFSGTRITKKHIASGFFVNSSAVITVKEIAEGSERIIIKDQDGNTFEVSSHFMHPYLDLAMLYLDREFNVMRLDNIYRPEPDDSCILMTLSDNMVSYQVTRIKTVKDALLTFDLKSCYSRPGSLIISSAGDVIGIFAGLIRNDGLIKNESASVKRFDDVFTGFGYSLDYAKYIYSREFNEQIRSRPRIGIKVSEKKGGIFIKEIMKDSPAEKADLKEEDQILAVNSLYCRSITDLYDAIYFSSYSGLSYEITIIRNNLRMKKQILLGEEGTGPHKLLKISGMELLSLNDQIRSTYNIDEPGYLVLSISEGAVLCNIIKVMDIIITGDERSLRELLKNIEKGIASELVIIRNGTVRKIFFER